jgi:hypothetical protein
MIVGHRDKGGRAGGELSGGCLPWSTNGDLVSGQPGPCRRRHMHPNKRGRSVSAGGKTESQRHRTIPMDPGGSSDAAAWHFCT